MVAELPELRLSAIRAPRPMANGPDQRSSIDLTPMALGSAAIRQAHGSGNCAGIDPWCTVARSAKMLEGPRAGKDLDL
jgi:hypothetical protein